MDYARFGSATTDAAGKAASLLPADLPLDALYAWKGGMGFDYRAYRDRRNRGDKDKPVKPDGPVVLALDGTAPVTVRAEDPEGRPIANLAVYAWYLQKPGEASDVNLSGITEELGAKTDAKGGAVFDWLPRWHQGPLAFWPHGKTHVRRRLVYDPKTGDGTLVAKLDRLVALRGRATLPDGKPAAGVRIRAVGAGFETDPCHEEASTGADGRFELLVFPHQAYLVLVEETKWSAPARSGFAVFPDKPRDDLDFALRLAVRLHGRVTVGKEKKPMAGQPMQLRQVGTPVALPIPENRTYHPDVAVYRHATTDEDGRYEFFVGPGDYHLRGPNQAAPKTFPIRDEKVVVQDFHAERQEEGRLTGVVVSGNPPKPVAGAVLWGVYRTEVGVPDLYAKTAADGRFEVTRRLYRTALYARTADRSMAGVVEISADAATVTIPIQPIGRAHGRLVDPEANPLAGREVSYYVLVPLNDKDNHWRPAFGGGVKTDKAGHFELTGLVVGQQYHVQVRGEKDAYANAKVRAKDTKPIDLGDLVLRPPYRPPTIDECLRTAFEAKSSPRERYVASLADAKLSTQRVLVVFADPASAGARHLFDARYGDDEVGDVWNDYRVVWVSLAEKALPAARELAGELKVWLEKAASPLLYVRDHEGTSVASTETKPFLKDGRFDKVALKQFLKANAPATLDARRLLADALARARSENKRVLVQETATWCAPCWALSRYLDRHRDTWAKDYLWVKIDRRWTNADEVMNGIRKGRRGGIPWTAILDADGKVLATSNDAKGNNVGFPSEEDGIDHFVAMIRKTAIRLTNADVAKLRKGLERR